MTAKMASGPISISRREYALAELRGERSYWKTNVCMVFRLLEQLTSLRLPVDLHMPRE